jgi:hypothetical protein
MKLAMQHVDGMRSLATADGQIILSFVLYNQDGVDWVRNVGWIGLAISGIFGWLPIYSLRKKGDVCRRG